jgi:hypothetical protein
MGENPRRPHTARTREDSMRPEDTQMASGRVEQPSLVERLRQPWPPSHSEDPLMTEAADEITRLEARVKEMEEVCRKLIAYEQAMDGGRDIDAMDYYAQASELARAALSQPAQPAPSAWRPIKDAPPDETAVLWLLRNGEIIIGPGLWANASIAERAAVYRETGEWPVLADYFPARWMPLPPPPEKGE